MRDVVVVGQSCCCSYVRRCCIYKVLTLVCERQVMLLTILYYDLYFGHRVSFIIYFVNFSCRDYCSLLPLLFYPSVVRSLICLLSVVHFALVFHGKVNDNNAIQ